MDRKRGERRRICGIWGEGKMRNYRQIFFLRITIRFDGNFCTTTVQIMLQLHAHRGFNRFFFLLFPPFFRWFINEKKVIGDYTTEMIIHNATRDLHDAIVKCEVHNDVGKSEDTETLDITCEYIKRGSNQLWTAKKKKGSRIRKNEELYTILRTRRKHGINIRWLDLSLSHPEGCFDTVSSRYLAGRGGSAKFRITLVKSREEVGR